jgi:hypothetical protein
LQAATDAGRTAITAIGVTIDELGADTHQQLARLHSLVPPTTPGAVVIYRITLSAVLDRPEHTVRVEFNGPAGDWSGLKPSIDQVLRTRQAAVQGRVDATFADPVPIGSEVMASITQRATDTGPARCTVTLITDGIG